MTESQGHGSDSDILFDVKSLIPQVTLTLEPVTRLGPFVLARDHDAQVANLLADIAVQSNMIDALSAELRQTRLKLDRVLSRIERFNG